MTLQHLLAEAAALAGVDLCAGGHAWSFVGGRPCPHRGTDANCFGSQSVYQCARCGDWDYGEPGGPGDEDCRPRCSLRALAARKEGEG